MRAHYQPYSDISEENFQFLFPDNHSCLGRALVVIHRALFPYSFSFVYLDTFLVCRHWLLPLLWNRQHQDVEGVLYLQGPQAIFEEEGSNTQSAEKC